MLPFSPKPEGDMLAEENAGLAPLIDDFFEIGIEGVVEDVAVGDVLGAVRVACEMLPFHMPS